MERGWKRRPRFSYAPCIDLWQPRGEGGLLNTIRKRGSTCPGMLLASPHITRGNPYRVALLVA
jgi:hypothetical protein